MVTSIGRCLRAPRTRAALSGTVAASVLLADLVLVRLGDTSHAGLRAIPPVVALAIYLLLARGDTASVGLRSRPIQGVGYWVRATAVIGLALGAFIAVAVVMLLLLGRPLPVHATRPHEFRPAFVHMCVLAPIAEEATYRLAFCTGAVPVLGAWGTVVASGLAFGGLHVLYGNPGPDNLIAGFVLGWAYLRSGTIAVPVALHSLGNLVALSAHVGARYWIDAASRGSV